MASLKISNCKQDYDGEGFGRELVTWPNRQAESWQKRHWEYSFGYQYARGMWALGIDMTFDTNRRAWGIAIGPLWIGLQAER